jgi:hypothetical protein
VVCHLSEERAITEYDGSYEFPVLAPGECTVELPFWGELLRGGGKWIKAVTIRSGETTTLDFGESGAAVGGIVRVQGTPKECAVITFKNARVTRWLQSDRNGTYHVYGLAAGCYRITVTNPGEPIILAEEQLQLTNGMDIRLDLDCP